MTSARSATRPRRLAIAAALEADATLRTALGGSASDPRIDAGTRPEPADGTAPLPPYVVLGPSPETPAGMFGQRGNVSRTFANEETLDVYARSKDEADVLYEHLVRILDLVPLAVAGFRPVVGRVRKVIDFPDADGTSHHLVATYSAFSQAVPA